MVEIIKQGNIQLKDKIKEFHCYNCQCDFKSDEYFTDERSRGYNNIYYYEYVICPWCKQQMIWHSTNIYNPISVFGNECVFTQAEKLSKDFIE